MIANVAPRLLHVPLLSLLVIGAGCARIQRARTIDGALTRPAAGATIPATAATACSPSTPASSRMGRVTLTFAGASGGASTGASAGASAGEAVVRVEGEAYKSTVRVDVATGTVLELREGEYQLRIAASGYRGGDRRVRVTCGGDEPVVVALSRP